ncbi:MAG: hypothetical protein QG635_573 [Bacteroidota bacterium]|nr:hypothetical protein [Bacteroidota bacterium]
MNASAGFHIGYVITKDYTQSEKIIGNGTFLDDNGNDTYKRTRNDTSGTLPDASGFYAAVIAGISYDLPLNSKGNLILAPEVNYALGLTPVIPDLSWSINSLRLGLAFKYCFGGMAPEKVIPPTAPPISEMPAAPIPPEEKPNILSADIIAVGLANDSTESALDKLKVEEFTSTLMTPLLNYIFFDDNSAEIPSRYKQINQTESRDFVVDKINSSEKLPTYYHILNIIGRRLRENPGSKITLIGCNSDVGEEAGNTELSKSRAETVKQYFTNIWSIEPARISVQPRNLPHKPAIKTTEEGAAENRRVEIQSDNPDMLAPVVTGEQYYQTEPLSIRFKNKIVADAGVKSWKIEISQSNKILNKFEGEGNLPPSFDWKINEAQASIPRYGNELNYKLTVTDMDGKEKSASKTFKVEQITISQKKTEKLEDKEIDFFSLILFDINSAELSQTNKKIADFVKSRIKSNSTVKISGFTDKTGLPENNSKLSLDRARNTAVYLGMESKPDTKVEINGFGDSRLICDNALPEGRYYCRIVDIVIETPIKSE